MDKNTARKAFKETCLHRDFELSKENALEIVFAIRESVPSQERWARFAKKSYASGIPYEDVMKSVSDWLDFLMD